jgi:hypothetical protein
MHFQSSTKYTTLERNPRQLPPRSLFRAVFRPLHFIMFKDPNQLTRKFFSARNFQTTQPVWRLLGIIQAWSLLRSSSCDCLLNSSYWSCLFKSSCWSCLLNSSCWSCFFKSSCWSCLFKSSCWSCLFKSSFWSCLFLQHCLWQVDACYPPWVFLK